MWELLRTITRSAVSALRRRRELALENLALRHQLAVLQRHSTERLAREALEEHCFLLTQRLAFLYELETPDFYDRSLFDNFVEMLIDCGFVTVDEEQRLTLELPLREIDEDVRLLLSGQVRHTILTMARSTKL